MNWIFVLILVFAAAVGSAVYITLGISRFDFMKRLIPEKKLRLAAGFACLAAVTAVLYLVWGYMNAAVCVIHLTLFWMIADGIGKLSRRLMKIAAKRYIAGFAAIAFTVVYLGWGYYNCFHVDVTRVNLESDKLSGSLRIIQFADSHIGTTFGAEGFKKQLERMNEYEPDIVVITGDFVDDSTTLQEMLDGCAALSALRTKYGVYYCFGNHDKGYYGRSHRGYGYEELVKALTDHGVTVLEDDYRVIDGRFAVAGRQDYSVRNRLPAGELKACIDEGIYTVLLDHQPHDYVNEAASGFDLVLSGHTHGGQMIPINRVGYWIGENDSTYGYERREGTDFFVTSGISNWELMFKTGCKSEFAIIDINRQED